MTTPPSNTPRFRLRWAIAALALIATIGVVLLTLQVTAGEPAHPLLWWLSGAVLVSLVFGAWSRRASQQAAAEVTVQAVGALAVAALVAVSYLVLVVGIYGRPHGSERHLMLVSLLAALVAV